MQAKRPRHGVANISQKGFDSIITNTMSALMSAGTTLKQAQVQQHAIKKDEGRAGVLKAEIEHSVKTDTSAKQAELEETTAHADDLRSRQTDTLETAAAELRDNIDRAREADREEEKEAAKTTEKKAADKTEKTDYFGNAPKADEKESADAEKSGETAETAVQVVIPDPIRAPKPMDVKA